MSMTLVERLDGAAAESSDPWNNAGTGHSALCELNYTPARPDGSIDIAKAVHVNEQFQVSRQFWTLCRRERRASRRAELPQPDPARELRAAAPTTSTTCRRRHEALVSNPLFASMEFIDDRDEFARRLPLMADKRDFSDPVGLNWTQDGTDVDFGSLSRQLIGFGAQHGMATLFGHEVAQPAARSPTARGRSRSSTGAPGRSGSSTPSSCSSARAAARCRCCRRRASRRSRGSAVSRSAASGFAPAIRMLAAETPGEGVRRCRRWALRRCRCRTWTPA